VVCKDENHGCGVTDISSFILELIPAAKAVLAVSNFGLHIPRHAHNRCGEMVPAKKAHLDLLIDDRVLHVCVITHRLVDASLRMVCLDAAFSYFYF
jgi:hypothetical protein